MASPNIKTYNQAIQQIKGLAINMLDTLHDDCLVPIYKKAAISADLRYIELKCKEISNFLAVKEGG